MMLSELMADRLCRIRRRTLVILLAYSWRTAQRLRVRALCAAFPSRSPLLPALTRSLRAALMFLTSTPQRARG
jgi:hypothetical protein